MKLTRKQALALGGVLLFILALLLINIVVPFGGRGGGPASPETLKIISAKLHHTTKDGKRHLEIVTNRAISGDTSFKAVFGAKTGYSVDVTGLLSSSDRVAGPTFLINVMDLPRFDEADKKKMLDEHVKAGNLFWIEVAIYNRGEFLHDPEVFQDSRKVAQAHFDQQ